MADKQYKFVQIEDPNTCPLDELEYEVERLKNLGDFYETKQLALKKFINSVYGATASKYFLAHNTAVAESITLQGQDLNHFSENSVNEYFSGIFQNDFELHKKLGIDSSLAQQVSIAKGKTTETGLLEGPEFWYLNGNQSLTVAGDTDSVPADTIVYTDEGAVTIGELYDECKHLNKHLEFHLNVDPGDSKRVVPGANKNVLSYVDHNVSGTYKPIKYVMKHKVFNKDKYKIKTESGKELILTGDHSLMVIRNEELISVPVREVCKSDRVITIG